MEIVGCCVSDLPFDSIQCRTLRIQSVSSEFLSNAYLYKAAAIPFAYAPFSGLSVLLNFPLIGLFVALQEQPAPLVGESSAGYLTCCFSVYCSSSKQISRHLWIK